MDARLKKLAVTIIMTAVLLGYILSNMEIVHSNNTDGEIDLFTQKEPYSGKGSNMPSDAFGAGEVVILYALVTNDGAPLPNLLVTFNVQGSDDTSFGLTAETNVSGIATINFTIPQKCDNATEVFGEWFTSANVLIGIDCFYDTLKFNVDWIVKLLSVRTIDENLTYRTDFGIEGDVGLEITLRNVAMCMKSTMLAVVIKDELNVPINHSEIHDFEAQPNEKLIFVYHKLYIPKWAHIGNATVFVSAFTAPANQSGVPYCPAISTNFFITPYEPLTIAFHDVAVVNVVPSATSVEPSQPLTVSVVVRNEGTEVESFNVSAYYDATSIGTLGITTLLPYSKALLNFTLDTFSIETGNYTITASIPLLVKEADLTDNIFVDGIVEVKPKQPVTIHDIAIVNVNISKSSVYIGDLLQIDVSVINKGNGTETFDVVAYCNSSSIETYQVSSFGPSALTKLTFTWNTSFILEGFYQISASAPLQEDINVSDNTFVDGVVQVKAKPITPPSEFHDVAVLDLEPSSSYVYIGGILDMNVTIKNEGSFVESFNVTIYYDEYIAGAVFVDSLMPNCIETLVFHWNTTDVTEGHYTLSARAEHVTGEEDTDDNYLENGVVEVRTAPAGRFVPCWLWWLLLLLLILMLILLAVWLCRRRKRKETEETFYSGWTAWYYFYDLRSRASKFRIQKLRSLSFVPES